MEPTKKTVAFRLDEERIAALNRIAANRQLAAGKRVSLQSVFEEAVDLLISRETGAGNPGHERQ
jgi:hypothetical protein